MRKLNYIKGSILIWTLLLGLSLATVFFFFSMRLNANVASQRQTMQYQTAKNFIDSYAAYIEQLPLGTLEDKKGVLGFHGVTGNLTNEVLAITGSLDAGEESAEYPFADMVKIKWNLCSNNLKTDLTVEDGGMDTMHPHVVPPPPDCSAITAGYDDETEIDVSEAFKIKSLAAPFQYSISSTTPGKLVVDNVWHLDIEIAQGVTKKIIISRTFTPSE